MQLYNLGNLKCTCLSLYSRRHEHLPLGCCSWCFRSVSLHLRWQWWRVSTGNRGTIWPVHKRVGAVCSNVFKSQWCWCHSREWQDICNRYGMCNAQQWWNCIFLLLKAFNISQKNWAKYFLVTPAELYFFNFFVRSLIVVLSFWTHSSQVQIQAGGGEGGLVWGNQSELRAGEAGGKRGKSRATKSQLILMLRLIGWKSGARLFQPVTRRSSFDI